MSLPESSQANPSGSPNKPAEPRPVVRFVGAFGILTALYFAFTVTDWFSSLLIPYLRINAELSAGLISLWGGEARAIENSIVSPHFSVTVARGCDALDPTALFVAAVIAFPVSFRLKLGVILAGAIGFQVLNLVRIVTLFYAGAFFPKIFDTLHHDIWQGFFICFAFLLWMIWASRVTGPERGQPYAPA